MPFPIILAEDDDSSRKLLEKQLTDAGYTVHCCANGREALALLGKVTHGIVIADWNMPEMDGLELCRSVRELIDMKALGLVYFVLLTAHSDRDQLVAGLEAGADEYLIKPCLRQELLARLRTGERLLTLHEELTRGQLEVHKANSQMAVLNRKLEKLANTDALTGLPNRRNVLERLARAWQQADRGTQALGVIMVDVDRFKRINDTHGHKAGDTVLVHVARTLSESIGPLQFCGRFGGEEFLIAAPGASDVELGTLAERLRVSIAERAVELNEGPLHVTASFGAAIRGTRHTGFEDLIAEADRMLYRAKENGRNQVWLVDADAVERGLQPPQRGPFRALKTRQGKAAAPPDPAATREPLECAHADSAHQ